MERVAEFQFIPGQINNTDDTFTITTPFFHSHFLSPFFYSSLLSTNIKRLTVYMQLKFPLLSLYLPSWVFNHTTVTHCHPKSGLRISFLSVFIGCLSVYLSLPWLAGCFPREKHTFRSGQEGAK